MKHAAFERAVEVLKDRDVLVSFSGGKDSLVLLDIAKRVSKRVECFFMYFVPGIGVVERQLAWAEQKYKVKIHQYPHWIVADFAINGLYRFHSMQTQPVDIKDIYAVARRDSGIQFIAHGAKAADSLWRRRTGAMKFAHDDLKAPIWDWSKHDVLGYLKSRNIQIPENDGRQSGGISISDPCIEWLYDHHREDYEKIARAYPFVGAIIKRREWFGVTAARDTRVSTHIQAAKDAAARRRARAVEEAGEGDDEG